jgi:hypothetical protein
MTILAIMLSILFVLQFHENPLIDPPYDEIQKPLEQLLWYLRQR